MGGWMDILFIPKEIHFLNCIVVGNLLIYVLEELKNNCKKSKM